jgi:hypothetical protein
MDLKYNTRTTATFEITAWEETPYDELGEGSKLSRATVKKIFRGEIERESTAELLMFQAGDGSASYVALERIVGRIGDRSDALQRVFWFVVPGSGTGELRGEAEYRHDEHEAKFTLDYDFE